MDWIGLAQDRPIHVVVSITVIKYTSVIKLCLTTYLLLVAVHAMKMYMGEVKV